MNSRPSLARALAIDTTTLPANSDASGPTVATALSQGVATTTKSQPTARSFDVPVIESRWSGHFPTRSAATDSARSASLDPITTCSPAAASLTARPRPAGPVPPTIPVGMGTTLAQCPPVEGRDHDNLTGAWDSWTENGFW